MGSKSFYDLDYIIELNEQRLEQYANALQKNTEKFTTLLMLYSAFCIFLIPVCQKLFIEEGGEGCWVLLGVLWVCGTFWGVVGVCGLFDVAGEVSITIYTGNLL